MGNEIELVYILNRIYPHLGSLFIGDVEIQGATFLTTSSTLTGRGWERAQEAGHAFPIEYSGGPQHN